jgi:hypothetical protein
VRCVPQTAEWHLGRQTIIVTVADLLLLFCAWCLLLLLRSDTTCAELALKLMQAGRQRMLKALSWLKRGLPFTQDSEISHVTEADAYRGGEAAHQLGGRRWELGCLVLLLRNVRHSAQKGRRLLTVCGTTY